MAAEEPMMDINTTPLIDVMLVLLIMLIITIPIQLDAVKINMPVGNPPPSEIKPEVLRLEVDERSHVLWNSEVVDNPADLERRLAQVAAQAEQPEVHLRPDAKAQYAVVAGLLTSVQRAGLTKLGIVGSEQFVP
ncbi:biopolymer transporter ExbD [Diaphorobacter ruginosibacter]|uniref:Biopolymer transporter ExbD n=2 Tax=Diaphorobacter ruginosibacter TaxID=1715720 RepID=A0A7G9RUV5_9BURK|nr:biopolymer transporter ExbD [Diaphorobacter ruginosibacter]